VEDQLGKLGVLHALGLPAPAEEGGSEVAERAPRLRLQLVTLGELPRRLEHRDAARAREVVDLLDGRIAEPALRHVDDALELEVVRGIMRHLQIRNGVLDFLPLIKARAADHAIGKADRDEAILEHAHLEGGAYQDRDLVEPMPTLCDTFDLLADRARFLLVVPDPENGDLPAGL